MDYAKSPDKSSPSFPENADEDDEVGNMELNTSQDVENNPDQPIEFKVPSVPQTITSGPTSVQNDYFDDVDMDMDRGSCVSYNNDPFNDSVAFTEVGSDKKVHWTNRDIQILLDRVEAHLEDFSAHKKHKGVWQAIGMEMEPLGFTAEHCYNKWKNLRRDVRLLVNNPLKAVRNADVLRRVARLILIIYPNVDASTMQVNERPTGGKSTPNKKIKTNSLVESPVGKRMISPTPTTTGPRPKCFPGNVISPVTIVATRPNYVAQNPPPSNYPPFSSPQQTGDVSMPLAVQNFNTLNNNTQQFNPPRSSSPKIKCENNVPQQNGINQAMLFMQSQLINDLMRQPIVKEEERTHSPLMNGGPGTGSGSVNSDNSQSSNVASLASSILTNLCSSGNTNSLLSTLVESLSGGHNSPCSPVPPNSNQLMVDRVQLTGELSVIVERLRDEEAVHLRLTEMVANLAEELRSAGQRRQAALDQLINLVKTGTVTTNGLPVSQSSTPVASNQPTATNFMRPLGHQEQSGIIIG